MGKRTYVDDAIKVLKDIGAKVDEISNNHRKISIYINGNTILWVAACTPSDWRAQKNSLTLLKRLLREAGINPPEFKYRGGSEIEEDLIKLFEIITDAENEEP